MTPISFFFFVCLLFTVRIRPKINNCCLFMKNSYLFVKIVFLKIPATKKCKSFQSFFAESLVLPSKRLGGGIT